MKRTGFKPRPRTKADGTIVFEAYAKVDGKQMYLGVRDTPDLAQELIDDMAAKARARKRSLAAGMPALPLKGKTLGDAAAEWLTYLENPDIDGYRSRAKYESQLRLHILPAFATKQLDEITPALVRAWLVKLTTKDGQALGREGEKLSPQTANTVRICLSSLLTWCTKEMDWLTVNPVGSTKQLKPRKREFQWIHSMDDVTSMLAAVEHDDARDFLALLVATGMRRGELLALHWSDCNLELRQLYVCAGGRGETAFETKPTKSNENRVVPLLDAALPILTARKLRTGGKGFVFASPTTGGIRNESTFCDAFRAALDKCGIERPGKPRIRIHDLRHTFAVHWVSSGGDIYALSKVLGHATVRTTEEYYADYQTENYVQHYHRVRFHFPAADSSATVTTLRAV